MTTDATAVVTEAVAEPVAPIVVAPEVKPAIGKDAARAQMHARTAAQTTAEPEVVPTTDPAVAGTQDAGGTASESDATAGTQSSDATPDAPAAAVQSIPVAISPDHYIREMGRDVINVADPASAQAVQALLNSTGVRRKENERLVEENRALREQVLRREATDAAVSKWEASPEYKEAADRYQLLLDGEERGEIPAGTALRDWKASQDKFEEISRAEIETRLSAAQQAEVDAQVQQWKDDAWHFTSAIPAQVRNLPETRRAFDEEYALFEMRLAAGHFPEIAGNDPIHVAQIAHKVFSDLFLARLRAVPAVQAAIASLRGETERTATAQAERDAATQRMLEQARREGADAVRADAAARRIAAPPHPMGAVAAAAAPATSPSIPDAPVDANLSSYQARQAAQKRARERADARFATRQ